MSAVSIEEGIRSAGNRVRLVLETKFVSFARECANMVVQASTRKENL